MLSLRELRLDSPTARADWSDARRRRSATHPVSLQAIPFPGSINEPSAEQIGLPDEHDESCGYVRSGRTGSVETRKPPDHDTSTQSGSHPRASVRFEPIGVIHAPRIFEGGAVSQNPRHRSGRRGSWCLSAVRRWLFIPTASESPEARYATDAPCRGRWS
jgi:hypothetical protein